MNDIAFIHLTETDSTNRYLQTAAERLASGSIVLADFQTNGRGQAGNSWESEAASNLTFSLLFRPVNVPANNPFVISEMASLSVKYTLDPYIADISVKWPNDIYWQDRKIAGILIENTIERGRISQSIIGIGLNVNQIKFHSNAPNPVSMMQAAGKMFDRMAVMNRFRQVFAAQSARVDQLCFASLHSDYLAAIYRREGYFRYADSEDAFDARIQEIEPSGHLVLERINGRLSRYAFKEVTFLI